MWSNLALPLQSASSPRQPVTGEHGRVPIKLYLQKAGSGPKFVDLCSRVVVKEKSFPRF